MRGMCIIVLPNVVGGVVVVVFVDVVVVATQCEIFIKCAGIPCIPQLRFTNYDLIMQM